MQPAAPHYLFDRLVLLIVVAALTIPAAYVEIARPNWQQLFNSAASAAHQLPSRPLHLAAAQPAAASSSQLAAPATVTKAAPKTAITNTYVHLRSSKSVNSQVITDIAAGTPVQLRDDADPTWQGVTYQGKNGYIYRAYLQY
jgi:hypothetical protein